MMQIQVLVRFCIGEQPGESSVSHWLRTPDQCTSGAQRGRPPQHGEDRLPMAVGEITVPDSSTTTERSGDALVADANVGAQVTGVQVEEPLERGGARAGRRPPPGASLVLHH